MKTLLLMTLFVITIATPVIADDPVCTPADAACTTSSTCGVSGQSCGTLASLSFDPAVNAAPPATKPAAADLGLVDLSAMVQAIRAQYRVPALVVAAARTEGLVAVGADGVRVAGRPERVTPLDKFHLGSCGKSITATVAARMVESGQIRWDATIKEMFPDLPGAAATVYQDVTLEQLLAHRSGMPSRDDAVMQRIYGLPGDERQQRTEFVRMAIALPPVVEPGTAFAYTDVGYTVAGVMLERAANTSWEALVVEHVKGPMGLESLGFGEPGSFAHTDQPWGHVAEGARIIPFVPGPTAIADNPPVIGPAGLVHLSILDWGRYASVHLGGARGRNGVLSAETFTVLHADTHEQNYGLGWGVSAVQDGTMLSHTGSCGEWYSLVWIVPGADLAVVVATNVSGGNAVAASNDVMGAVFEQLGAEARH